MSNQIRKKMHESLKTLTAEFMEPTEKEKVVKKLCMNCSYWSRSKNLNFGVCQLCENIVQVVWDEAAIPDDYIGVVLCDEIPDNDGVYCSGQIITGESFGCVHFRNFNEIGGM